MRSFLKKGVCFLLLALCNVMALFVFMFIMEQQAYYRGLKLASSDRFVAVGDSRSKQNLNPDYVSGLANRALGGSPWCVWMARMRDFIQTNRDGIKRAFILEVYPRVLADARPRKLRDCDYAKALLWILHPELHEKIPFENVYFQMFQNEFPERFVLAIRCLLTGKKYPGFMDGGFQVPKRRGGYTLVELRRFSEEQEKLLAGFRMSESEKAEIADMVREIRESGWDIVFVTFPTFPDARAQNRDFQFKSDVSSLCANLKVAYFNFSNLGQDEMEWIDIIHQNYSGSVNVWKAVTDAFSVEFSSGNSANLVQ